MTTAPASVLADVQRELARQLEHWRLAASRLADLDAIAPVEVWQGLEHYLGVSLRGTLGDILRRLERSGEALAARLRAAGTSDELARAREGVLDFRRRYLRAETTIDFYADALATRASPRIGALLRACDHIATRSMAEALSPLGRQVPAALTYLDSGIGASVLRAGIRLWDGSADSPVATIKITRHNLLRPSSAIHEAGHQVAHMLGWNDELSARLAARLAPSSPRASRLFASWASEIAADAFAFVHSGYASVAALHDVVDGGPDKVFAYLPHDPHPVSYLRVRLGVALSRDAYGKGPWDELETAWCSLYPVEDAPEGARALLQECVPLLRTVASVLLRERYRAFGGKPLVAIVDPQRVSPTALGELDRHAGAAAFTSPYWIWNESIRLLALTGYRAAEGPEPMREAMRQQERWMLRLGGAPKAA